MNELVAFALNHAQQKFNITYPRHGLLLTVAQASGDAKVLISNPGAEQVITGAKLTLAATAAGYASANLPPGTAPSSPVNGDIWVTASGFFVQIAGVTQQMATALGYTPVNKAGDTMTGSLINSSTNNQDRNGNFKALTGSNSLLFGHSNTGYTSSVGAYSSNGQPFLAFYAYHSTTANTLKRASGTNLPSVLHVTTAGLLEYRTAPAGTVDADISNFTTVFSISNAGVVTATDLVSSTAVAIGMTTAGQTPTKFMGLNAGHCLFVDATSGTVINSGSDVIVNIDSDNNSTTASFKVRKNTNNTTGGGDLLIVNEDGDATATRYLKGVQHASIGSAAAAGTAVVAGADGKIPLAALPGAVAQVVADVTAAKALTGLTVDSLVLIKDFGLYRFASAQDEVADDETAINVTAGGQLLMELAHADAIMAYVSNDIAALEADVEALQEERAALAVSRWMVYRSTSDQTLTNNVENTIVYNTAGNDPNGDFNLTTGEFTVPVDGTYRFDTTLVLDTNNAYTSGAVYKDGVFVESLFAHYEGSVGTVARPLSGYAVLELNKGNVIKVVVNPETTGSRTLYYKRSNGGAPDAWRPSKLTITRVA